MKSILMLVGQSLIQQFLKAPDHGHGQEQGQGIANALLEPAKEYVADTVKRYALTAVVAFLFSLYFVAGTLIMITSAASSFDAFGFFAPGTFFFSGVAITVISIAVLAGCYFSMKKGAAPKKAAQPVVEEAPARPDFAGINLGQFGHIAEAVVTGVISGLISRRFAKPAEPATFRERLRRVI